MKNALKKAPDRRLKNVKNDLKIIETQAEFLIKKKLRII